MPARATYAVDFEFLDPIRIAVTGYPDQAIVRVVAGLFRGSYADLGGLSPKRQTELLGHSLIELQHRVPDRKRLEAKATEQGAYVASYCARCGRKFVFVRGNGYKCPLCDILFRLRSSNDVVIGAFPLPPRRVFTYLREHGYKFQRPIPRL